MAIKIKIEGQTIDGASQGITDEIAQDDEMLKSVLAPVWPDVRTATIKREGGTDGKDLVVTVTKRAGTKGVSNAELDEQARSHIAAQREAERVRKLEDLAMAVDRFFSVWWEFGGRPAAEIVAAVSEYVDDLGDAFDEIGPQEIARIKSERRVA